MTNVSTSHINDIENNKKEPSLSIAVMLAKALKVDITEIYRVKNQLTTFYYFVEIKNQKKSKNDCK